MSNERGVLGAPIFWGSVVLAAGLVVAALIGGVAVERLRRAGDEITVTGSSRKPITSDLAMWRGSVSVQRATLPEASDELARITARVKAFIVQRGFPDSTVEISSINSNAVRERVGGEETNRVIGLRDDPVTVISSPARRRRSTAKLPMRAATTRPPARTTDPQKIGAPSTPRSFDIVDGAPASKAEVSSSTGSR